MSKHLTMDGNLTASQLIEADRLKIPHEEYTQIVLKNLADSFTPNDNDVNIECKNPVIIIGRGGGWCQQMRKIRNTKIPIVAVEVSAFDMLGEGIIPQYITTLESAPKRINATLFNFPGIAHHKIKVIGSMITREWLSDELKKYNQPLTRFKNYDSARCSNVGTFTACFARDVLKADKIIMIGMNSWADDNDNPYLIWYTDWRYFIRKSPNSLLVNCTQGGLLYGDKIISADFNRLTVNGK